MKMILQNKKQEAIDYIMAQLDDGYIDLGLHDNEELKTIYQAMSAYIKIPEVIHELEKLKITMDGQIFYNESSRFIYEERMEIVNDIVDEAIYIVKGLMEDEENSSNR